jgi:hypothetical protein
MQVHRLARASVVAGALLLAGGASAIGLGLLSQDAPPQVGVTAVGSLGRAAPAPSASPSAGPTESPRWAPASRWWSTSRRMSPSGSPSESPSASSMPDERSGAVLSRSEPVGLDIPAIDVSTDVFPIGLNADGGIAVPEPGPRYDSAAWYRYSPTPGQLGPSVIEGHLDSAHDGPSVFYRLGELEPGQEISVRRADGLTALFRVTSVGRYAKARFPTSTVYGDLDYPGLRLITCGGGLDSVTRHYLDNTVVFATFISAHPTAG